MKKIIFIYALKAVISKMYEKYKKELVNFEESLSNYQSVKYWEYNEDEGAYNIRIEQELRGKGLFLEPLSQATELCDALTEPIFNKSVRIAIDGLYEEQSSGMVKLSLKLTKKFVDLMDGFGDITTFYITDQLINAFILSKKYSIDDYRKEILLYNSLKSNPKSVMPILCNYLNENPQKHDWYSLFTYFEENHGFDLIAQSLKNNTRLNGVKPSVHLNANQDLPC